MRRNVLILSPVLTLVVILLTARPAPDGPPAQVQDACWILGDRSNLDLRISRLDSISTTLDGHMLKLCYSRPRALGRPIMGRLVPFGEPWRLGANEATALHTPTPLMVGDVRVAPGSYSLYAIPDSTEWRVAVNGTARRWGIPISSNVRQADLGVTVVLVERLPEPVEVLTMRFDRAGPAVDLVIEWERTRIRLPIRLVSS